MKACNTVRVDSQLLGGKDIPNLLPQPPAVYIRVIYPHQGDFERIAAVAVASRGHIDGLAKGWRVFRERL